MKKLNREMNALMRKALGRTIEEIEEEEGDGEPVDMNALMRRARGIAVPIEEKKTESTG